jgi:hypothetical protein
VRTTALSCLVFAGLLTACGGGQTEAQKTASMLSGADKLAADKNPQCKLFTPAELAKFVGTPLTAGRDAAMGSGCQWVAVSGTGSALIQVVPAQYHEPHSGAKGFREVPDVGSRGFVEQEIAIELLKETIKRRTK